MSNDAALQALEHRVSRIEAQLPQLASPGPVPPAPTSPTLAAVGPPGPPNPSFAPPGSQPRATPQTQVGPPAAAVVYPLSTGPHPPAVMPHRHGMAPPAPNQGWAPPGQPAHQPFAAPSGPAASSSWGINVEQVLKWSGLTLVVCAAIFAVATGISRGWITPEMQLAAAALSGLSLIGLGLRMPASRKNWGEAMVCAGGIIVPTCAVAANVGLDLIGGSAALVTAIVVVTGLQGLAQRISSQPLAITTVLTGIALTTWMAGEQAVGLALLGGMLGLMAAMSTVASVWKPWTLLRVLGVGAATSVAWFLVFAAGFEETLLVEHRPMVIVMTALLGVLVWVGPMIGAWRESVAPVDAALRAIDDWAVAFLPFWAFSIVGFTVEPDGAVATSLLALGISLLFALPAVVARLTARQLFSTRLLAAHLLGTAALASLGLLIASANPLSIVGFAALALLMAFGCIHNDHGAFRIGAIASVGVAGLAVSASILAGWMEPQGGARHLANLVVVAGAVGAMIAMRRHKIGGVAELATVGTWGLALALVPSLALYGWQGQMVISAAWACASAMAIAFGVYNNDRLFRLLGLSTLGVVLAKMATVDLAEIDPLWRVLLFAAVGVTLLRLGYVLPRLARRAEPPTSEVAGVNTPG